MPVRRDFWNRLLDELCTSVRPSLTRSQAAQLFIAGIPNEKLRQLQCCLFDGLAEEDIPTVIMQHMHREYLEFKKTHTW